MGAWADSVSVAASRSPARPTSDRPADWVARREAHPADRAAIPGSVPSLGAGLLFGGILGYGAYQMSQNPNAYHILLGTSTVLGGLMGYRFYNSGKFMPAGLVAALSVGMVLRIAAQRGGLIGVQK